VTLFLPDVLFSSSFADIIPTLVKTLVMLAAFWLPFSGAKAMTSRQRRFVDEYLVDLNATQAAIRAGYSARTANEQGARLLTNASVASAIQAAQQARSERVQITQATWCVVCTVKRR
jgi:hypothetical protein